MTKIEKKNFLIEFPKMKFNEDRLDALSYTYELLSKLLTFFTLNYSVDTLEYYIYFLIRGSVLEIKILGSVDVDISSENRGLKFDLPFVDKNKTMSVEIKSISSKQLIHLLDDLFFIQNETYSTVKKFAGKVTMNSEVLANNEVVKSTGNTVQYY